MLNKNKITTSKWEFHNCRIFNKTIHLLTLSIIYKEGLELRITLGLITIHNGNRDKHWLKGRLSDGRTNGTYTAIYIESRATRTTPTCRHLKGLKKHVPVPQKSFCHAILCDEGAEYTWWFHLQKPWLQNHSSASQGCEHWSPLWHQQPANRQCLFKHHSLVDD